MSNGPVLLTWVAVNNDPHELDNATDAPRLLKGSPVPGPTLTLLQDEASSYRGRIHDVVLFHRDPPEGASEREQRAVKQLQEVLRKQSIRVECLPWSGSDPTDHRSLFDFLRQQLPQLRRRFASRELVLHISPGTPSMHTVWVLMAETGFVDPPFSVVKSYRAAERRGGPAVRKVQIGIETYYKNYKASLPRQAASEDQRLVWDPARFRTEVMQRVYAEARRYAQLNVPVLIRGERGTGKTTLASWIRSNSPFRRTEQDARWPAVACGQYSSETMRAELFGYRKGAFTGASTDRDGLLHSAHGDTLFLDEIGDISRDLQRLLIKTIEERSYFPLGDDKPRKSDFRLVTATNLEEDDLRQRLDPDFRDRISLLTLTLPPLRQIPDELPWLWEGVYAEATQRARLDDSLAALDAKAQTHVVERLQHHPLPGNIRDLFRVAYRILAARCDRDAPLSPTHAVESGLQALEDPFTRHTGNGSLARQIAGAFASGHPIDPLLDAHGPLPTKEVLAEFRSFLASELRRVADSRHLPLDQLCDVTPRTLLTWASPQKDPSNGRKGSSD